MNIKEYIESGILEMFVFGKLSKTEEEEVLRNANQYPEIKEELTKIELAFEQYAISYGVPPPPGTLSGILRKTGSLSNTEFKSSGSSSAINYLLTALTAVSFLGAYYFYNSYQQAQEKIAGTQAQLAQLEEDCNSIRSRNTSLFAQTEVLLNPDYSNISMGATGKYENTDSRAGVLYNTVEEKAWLNTQSLPPAPAGKQYQLWAIVDGKPVDMGVFDLTVEQDTVLQEVPFIAQAQAFAVTIETEGGSPTPSLEEMIVVGNVG